MKKLNVGCGLDIREGWTNLDMHKKYGADIVFDLNQIYRGKKIPFKDNTFDYVYCSHVLEDFIEPIPIIDELVRICKIGGRIEIKTPFETNTWIGNIYHKRPFTLSTFESYVNRKNYGEKRSLKIIELKYYCQKGDKTRIHINFFKSIIESFYNLFPYKLVEKSFIKYLFPVINCKVIYQKIK